MATTMHLLSRAARPPARALRRGLHASAARRLPQHTMNRKVIITCAVTGSGDTAALHPGLPKSPKEIADACIEAGEAGAAIAHLHVREPETGGWSRDVAYYKEVLERIRARRQVNGLEAIDRQDRAVDGGKPEAA